MTKTNYPQNNHSAKDAEVCFYLSMQEVTTSFGTSVETIVEIINEGIVHSRYDHDTLEWRFDDEACRRIRLVLQLNRDLGINIAGAALVLELLNEVDHLHSRLAHLSG